MLIFLIFNTNNKIKYGILYYVHRSPSGDVIKFIDDNKYNMFNFKNHIELILIEYVT
jgi:hypothetical protein